MTPTTREPGESIPMASVPNLRVVYDLRTEAEATAQPDRVPPGTECVALDVLADLTDAAPTLLLKAQTNPTAAEEMLGGRAKPLFEKGYRATVTLRRSLAAYRGLFFDLAHDERRPALFHCKTGNARTGWAAAATSPATRAYECCSRRGRRGRRALEALRRAPESRLHPDARSAARRAAGHRRPARRLPLPIVGGPQTDVRITELTPTAWTALPASIAQSIGLLYLHMPLASHAEGHRPAADPARRHARRDTDGDPDAGGDLRRHDRKRRAGAQRVLDVPMS